MNLIRAGVDSLYLAIHGHLAADDMGLIAAAKEKAIRERQAIPIAIGPGQVEIQVHPHGSAGGYPFAFETGPVGERWACRLPYRNNDWDLFVRPFAACLLAHGYRGAIARIFARLEAMGATVIGHSINRIDYAMDFRADDFDIELNQFVAPPRTKRKPYWATSSAVCDVYHPAAVLTGRRLESVTIGRFPGRQVQVYDKTAEVRANGNPIWWSVWGIDPNDPGARVFRVELRAGRQELKARRKVTGLHALEAALRPMLSSIVRDIRYLDGWQSDSNVSRQQLHPLWQSVTAHVDQAELLSGDGEIPEERVLELTLKMKIEIYEQQILGNSAGLAAALGHSDLELATVLPDRIKTLVHNAATQRNGSFRRSVDRAALRLAPFTRGKSASSTDAA